MNFSATSCEDLNLPSDDMILSEDTASLSPVSLEEDGPSEPLDAIVLQQRGAAPQWTDPYQKFWKYAIFLGDYEDGLIEIIGEETGMEFTSYAVDSKVLKNLIPPEKMEVLADLMEWVSVFSVGRLWGQSDSKAVKEFLGIREFIDILSLMLEPHKGKCHLTVRNLLEMVDQPDRFVDADSDDIASDLTGFILEGFLKFAEPVRILGDIEAFCALQPREYALYVKDVFFDMDLKTQLLWGLFESVTCYHMSIYEERMTARPGQWPSTVTRGLIPLLEQLDASLRKMPKTAEAFKLSASLPTPVQVAQFAPPPSIKTLSVKPAELPNWMPNGGNSCYISSSLWGLFFAANRGVHAKLPLLRLASESSLVPEPLRKAGQAFIKLYEDLSAPEKKRITFQTVNAFRNSLQSAFPGAFFSPHTKGQEDAFEFLTMVMASFLNLDACAASAPKFQKFHRFKRTDDLPLQLPETYDYAQALKSVSRAERLPLIDIRLENDQRFQSLKTLVTRARTTDQGGERHAYLYGKDCGEYRIVMTEHTEQLLVNSKESAPDYFIGRLARFSLDHDKRIRSKLFHVVYPNATLDFGVLGSPGETVCYDLVAITVHRGDTIEGGHYYNYLPLEHEGERKFFKYDDSEGCEECEPEIMVADAMYNGYIYFYKKREEGKSAPPPLPMESEFEEGRAAKMEDEVEKKVLKRPRSPVAEDDAVAGTEIDGTLQDVPAQKPRDFQEAKEWVTQNLTRDFFLHEAGFPSIEDLLLGIYRYEVDAQPAKRAHSKEREFLIAASRALQRPIFLIAPLEDKELNFIDSYLSPGENYRHGDGEDYVMPAIYIFKQKDGSCFLIEQKDQ